MAVLIEQRDNCLDQSAAMLGRVRRRSSRGSERLFVVPGIAPAGINESPLLPEQLMNLIAVHRQDLVPEIVDQFEHREGDLR